MRFVMKLELTQPELDSVKDIDVNCSNHISVVNDIVSFDKELKQAESCKEEGSILCSSVQIIGQECNLDATASKGILWAMCRE